MVTAPSLAKYGYTLEQVNSVPGLNEALDAIGNNPDAPPYKKVQQTLLTIKSTLADPVSFVKKRMALSIYEGAKSGNYDTVKKEIAFLQKSNVPSSEISSVISSSTQKATEILKNQAESKSALGELTPLVGIALAFALPSMGETIGQALLSSGALAAGTSAAYATAVGTAMASIAVQTAQGVPLEDAIKNAGVNAIVQTGSASAATQLNNIIKNPAVTDALVSAGGSAVKTIASGGSAEDIKKNIVGAVAGSATTSVTGSQVAGSAVGGGVTGGVTGALSGAAGALGQDAAKPKDTTTPATTAAETTLDPATQQLVSAIQKEQTSPTPSTELGKVAAITSNVPGYVTDTSGGGALLNLPAAGVTAGGVAPNVEVTATQSGTPTLGETKQDVLETITAPKTTDTTAATSGYTPTITTTPSTVVKPTTETTPTPVSPDKAILDLISKPAPTTTPTTTPTTIPTTDTLTTKTPTTPVTRPTSQPPVAVSPTAPEQVLPEVVATATQDKETTAPTTDTKTDTKAPLPVDVAKEELPPEETTTDSTKPADKYKPSLLIYGGTSPSTLPRTLGTGATYATSVGTTGLTGERGAGEIESKETGKKRKNVWNEASLRLKDALGV